MNKTPNIQPMDQKNRRMGNMQHFDLTDGSDFDHKGQKNSAFKVQRDSTQKKDLI